MTATNHAVTGALVAAAINKPVLALPAALLSHFATDGLPHWDYYKFASTRTRKHLYAALDLALAISLLIVFVLTVDASVWLLIAGAALGILPDGMWLPFIISGKPSVKGNKNSPLNILKSYHLRIQWLETPKLVGLYAELFWLFLMLWLIYQVHH